MGGKEHCAFTLELHTGTLATPCHDIIWQKKSAPFSNIGTVSRNKIILFWASMQWIKLNYSLDWKLVVGWRPVLLTPLHPHEQTEGRCNDYTWKKTHRYTVLQEKAQLHWVKGKSLAELFKGGGIERRIRRKIDRFFKF